MHFERAQNGKSFGINMLIGSVYISECLTFGAVDRSLLTESRHFFVDLDCTHENTNNLLIS